MSGFEGTQKERTKRDAPALVSHKSSSLDSSTAAIPELADQVW